MVPVMEGPPPRRRSGEERLLLAILCQALQDARHRHYTHEARVWLQSEGCAVLCLLTNVDYALVCQYVSRLYSRGIACMPDQDSPCERPGVLACGVS
jgi:hypothetical protein